jgi:hypothetical protein
MAVGTDVCGGTWRIAGSTIVCLDLQVMATPRITLVLVLTARPRRGALSRTRHTIIVCTDVSTRTTAATFDDVIALNAAVAAVHWIGQRSRASATAAVRRHWQQVWTVIAAGPTVLVVPSDIGAHVAAPAHP